MKTISKNEIAAGNAKHLNEFLSDLPGNCRLNKVLTGCGGTTVALENDIPYVICMPFTALIRNKMEWCKNIGIEALPVYQNAGSVDDVANFQGKKIMVTYDSLFKVVEGLGERVNEFKILIDEYHLLVNSGKFRKKAVRTVLKEYKKFKDYVFMTATPTEYDYLPMELQEVPEVIIKWNNIEEVTIEKKMVKQGGLLPYVAALAYKHAFGEEEGNAYFFFNSVDSTLEVIRHLKKLGLKNEMFRLVCSDNENNRAKVKAMLGKDFFIGNPLDDARRINFITSTAFEGCDFFDKVGRTYVVTNGRILHTKYDILTTLPQIIGRIRNSIYRNHVKLIFSPSPENQGMSKEEYSRLVLTEIEKNRETVEIFKSSNLNDNIKELILAGAKENPYLIVENDTLELDETEWCAKMQSYTATYYTYSARNEHDSESLANENLQEKVINHIPHKFYVTPKNIAEENLTLMRLGASKKNFKELAEIYHKHNYSGIFYGSLSDADEERKRFIEATYPIIPEAFIEIGFEKMKKLEFNKRKIHAEIIKRKCISDHEKMRELLPKEKYDIGRSFTYFQGKKDLQQVFDLLGIQQKAKARDFENIFELKEARIPINEKRHGGFTILGYK